MSDAKLKIELEIVGRAHIARCEALRLIATGAGATEALTHLGHAIESWRGDPPTQADIDRGRELAEKHGW